MTGTPLIIAAVLVPAALAVLAAAVPLGARARWLLPIAPLAGVALWLSTAPGSQAETPWLLGVAFGVDDVNRLFLAFTSVLWLLAGAYAAAYFADRDDVRRFSVFFLAVMAANLGVVLALDAIGFIACFAMLGFSVYGLVVNDLTREALRAGRVYIGMAVASEVSLFVGLVLLAGSGSSLRFSDVPSDLAALPHRGAICTMFVIAFGIKLGVAPLHVWLPLAHPVAPTPASAMLSGVIVKTGLLGLLRLLPLGDASLPILGPVVMLAGVASAFGAVAVGLMQRDGKTMLAYSTVSQMGIVAMGLGAGLLEPALWPRLAPVLLVMAAHHGVTKAALFLGIGVTRHGGGDRTTRWIAGAALVVLAWALAGGVGTLGHPVKSALKAALGAAGAGPPAWAAGALAWTSVATTLLMARVLVAAWPPRGGRAPSPPLLTTWLLGVALVVGAAWVLPDPVDDVASLHAKGWWNGLWPVAVGVIVVGACLRSPRTMTWLGRRRVPAGDLFGLEVGLAASVSTLAHRLVTSSVAAGRQVAAVRDRVARWLRWPERVDRMAASLESGVAAGLLVGLIVALLFTLL